MSVTNNADNIVLVDEHSPWGLHASEIRNLGVFLSMHGNLFKLQDILINKALS
jgi:hypothetical protein